MSAASSDSLSGLQGDALDAALSRRWTTTTEQVTVGSDGVRLRWLFLRESWPAESIVGLRVQTDPRRWAWPRRKVLIIERRNHRASLVFGSEEVLSRLAAAA